MMAAVGPAFGTHAQDPRPTRPTRRHQNVRILSAVLVVVVLAAIAVAVHRASRARVSVAVVGDSITVAAQPDIAASLSGAYRPDIHAIWGQRIDQMLPTLAVVLHRHPSDVVVNLGTNDAIQAATHTDWQRAFNQMIAMLATTHCVVLTTVSTRLDASPASLQVATAIDAAITSVASTRPTFHVVDWNAALHRASGDRLLSSDRIHPSPAGQLTLAALIRTALDHDCGRSPK
jgi:lysophospholipase L1-like esterase